MIKNLGAPDRMQRLAQERCLLSGSRSIVIDGSDLRFAAPRCWSGGDSNHRSSLVFSTLEGAEVRRFFWPEFVARSLGEQFSDRLQRSNPAETSSLS